MKHLMLPSTHIWKNQNQQVTLMFMNTMCQPKNSLFKLKMYWIFPGMAVHYRLKIVFLLLITVMPQYLILAYQWFLFLWILMLSCYVPWGGWFYTIDKKWHYNKRSHVVISGIVSCSLVLISVLIISVICILVMKQRRKKLSVDSTGISRCDETQQFHETASTNKSLLASHNV